MSSTCETSHPERFPLKAAASRNMLSMLGTPDRSGASDALYSMLEAPRNAEIMVVHSMSPHCSMDCSFCAFVASAPRLILSRPPVMETV